MPKDDYKGDLNDLTKNGVYRISGGLANAPTNAPSGGIMLVINWNNDVIMQIVTNDLNKWSIRMKWYYIDWKSWAQLT